MRLSPQNGVPAFKCGVIRKSRHVPNHKGKSHKFLSTAHFERRFCVLLMSNFAGKIPVGKIVGEETFLGQLGGNFSVANTELDAEIAAENMIRNRIWPILHMYYQMRTFSVTTGLAI